MKPQAIAEWTQQEVGTILYSVARYTRFVRSTKVILVLMVVVLTALVLFYLLTHNEDNGIRVAFTSVEKGTATPTQMINARFHGMDKSDQPFNVTSALATQKDLNTLNLDKVTGDISLKSGTWLSVTANNGVFYMKEKLLDLTGNIEMFDDQGYEMRTQTLHVDINTKSAVTKDHVSGQGPLGKLEAQGAVADGIAQTITFGKPVFVTVYTTGKSD